MRPFFRICCAVFTASLAIPSVRAGDPVPLIETDRFQVTDIYGQYAMGGLPELTLVSNADGVTIFSLDNLAGDLQSPANGPYLDRGVSVGFEPKPGYVITGWRYSANVVGSFFAESAPAGATNIVPARAGNYSGSYLDTALAGELTGPMRDINGTVPFSLYIPNVDPERRFGPGLYSAVVTTAVPGSYWLDGVPYPLAASATMRIENPVFIVYTQALLVPEPGVWMMLSVGLASLCAVSRRRARADG